MPKIEIREHDYTSLSSAETLENVVFVPGNIDLGDKMDSNHAILFTSPAELEEAFEGKTKGDIYAVMHLYLKLGLNVLYGYYTNPSAKTFTYLKDKTKYVINYLTGGIEDAFEGEDDNNINKAILAVAEARQDCVALIDHNKNENITDSKTYAEYVRVFIDKNFSSGSKYAAAFSPWANIDISSADIEGKDNLDVPGSVCKILAIGNALQSGATYKASAGVTRGVIPYLNKVLVDYGDTEIDTLGGRSTVIDDIDDNVNIAVNAICNIRPYGPVVWGDRTLIKNEEDTSGDHKVGKLTASSFLNIRNICTLIKHELHRLAQKYTFEQNSDILWINFKAEIEKFLQTVQNGQGIAGFRVLKVHTNKKGRLCARIKLVAIEPVEDFIIDIELTDSLEEVVEA